MKFSIKTLSALSFAVAFLGCSSAFAVTNASMVGVHSDDDAADQTVTQQAETKKPEDRRTASVASSAANGEVAATDDSGATENGQELQREQNRAQFSSLRSR
jgi:hypothetical protein